jgi:P27 family predicted phage terminase small subunit
MEEIMSKGRKKLPDQLKLIKGTLQKCRASSAPGGQDEAPMTAPSNLSEGELAHFQMLKERVALVGLDSATFTELLVLAAKRLAEIDDCDLAIAEHGRIIETTTEAGNLLLRANPAITMRAEAMRHLQSLLAEFGLTPSASARVSGKKPTPKPHGFGGL